MNTPSEDTGVPWSNFEQKRPVCPHCGHEIPSDDMPDATDYCLFDLAHDEDTNVIECPKCDREYWVRGGWSPHYTTARTEDEL